MILSHGFPEGAYSWRHQLVPLAEAGFHAIAPDQRGYGALHRPRARSRTTGIEHLAADLLGLLDETGYEQGVFVGHDWGTLIVWDLIRLHPDHVRGVVGVSVPFIRLALSRRSSCFRQRFGDRFFYIVYFQDIRTG